MTPRYGQWYLLGHDGDPVSADLHSVLDRARQLQNTAVVIQEQTQRLRQLAGSDLRGEYIETLQSKGAALAHELARTQGRYSDVASALRDWAPDLEIALDQSAQALIEAQNADAQRIQGQAMWIEHPQPGQPLTAVQIAHNNHRKTLIADAADDLAAAKGRLESALHQLDDAAGRVAPKIEEALHDGVSDTWWDRNRGTVIKIVHAIVETAKIVGAILAVAAIILAIVFPPGALVLGVIAVAGLALAAVALAGDTFLYSQGEATARDLFWDTLNLIPAMSGVLKIGAALSATRALSGAGKYRAIGAAGREVIANLPTRPPVKLTDVLFKYAGDRGIARQAERLRQVDSALRSLRRPGMRGSYTFQRGYELFNDTTRITTKLDLAAVPGKVHSTYDAVRALPDDLRDLKEHHDLRHVVRPTTKLFRDATEVLDSSVKLVHVAI